MIAFRTLTRLPLALVILALMGCVPAGRGQVPGPQEAIPELAGTQWELVALDGDPLAEGSRITMALDEGRLSGFGGCNRYGATYALGRDGDLEIVEPMHHAALCTQPAGVMEQEDAYIRALCAASALRIVGDRLEISDATGEARLVFRPQERLTLDPAALIGTRWDLLVMAGTGPVEGMRYTLSFDSATELTGEAACRTYRGTYKATGDDIDLHFLEMAGEPCLDRQDAMEQEGAFTTALESIDQYRLSDDRLELVTQGGEVLVFVPAK